MSDYPCDDCIDLDCMMCYLGNPCLGCEDYDTTEQKCTSDGACGKKREEVEE